MPSYKVKVKWGKETYPDIELNTDESPLLFKAQLFALTGVQPERQKVMLKGATLKDNDWANFKLKDGATILLMGSKEEDVPKEPVEKTVFVEDMNESELASALDLPAGLMNLGNTCYMNATVQCLKSVPELREALQKFDGGVSLSSGIVPAQSITAAMRDLFANMDKGQTIPPILLLQVLHLAFPRFAEKNDHGYIQQDANECWSELVRMLQQKLPAKQNNGDNPEQFKSLIDQFFGGSFDVELRCTEAEDEPVTKSKEQFLQLSCFISQDVRYMHSGLRNKLQEQITKLSPTLERDAVYTKTNKICRLPAYLTVQFVRFYYKEKESINAKILKDVKFPLDFDAFDLCSLELQEKLAPMRAKFKDYEDLQVELASKSKDNKVKNKGDSKSKEVLKKYEPYYFKDDLGSNNSGYYTLQAVLTHQGRSSSSGHYVGWVRQSGDKWVKCDDELVSPVTTEDILKLSGGGIYHYLQELTYSEKSFKTMEKKFQT